MVRIDNIRENPRCVASITVHVRKGKSNMQVGDRTLKIRSILHKPQSGAPKQ